MLKAAFIGNLLIYAPHVAGFSSISAQPRLKSIVSGTSTPRIPTAVANQVTDREEAAPDFPLRTNDVPASPPAKKWPSLVSIGLVVAAGLAYAPAWSELFQQMDAVLSAQGVADTMQTEPSTAALSFWFFFALLHPILEPVLWISEVLHSSPGPLVADLVPVSFIAANILVIAVSVRFEEVRTVATGALAAAFLAYVGAGVNGDGNMGAYNLALNDGGVKGCPTYDQVRQPSVKGLDLEKYQGKWYEHGFHDWTQFTETYDTSLDIQLNADKTRWLDDFGLKGPSPQKSPLAYDKSPVANGAHYFLYGKLNEKEPGVAYETGFGVTFPNYIVDVQSDAKGEYTEAIQFQCLERGGVRVFEGINFLSRSKVMTPEQKQAMFARAAAAGLEPYGATVTQMHQVTHTPSEWEPIENSWQTFWNKIGVGKLLALLESSTHSVFEDTGERVQ